MFNHLTNNYIKNDNIKLKIAILGSPGSGKSTLGAGLLYFSKLFFFKTDYVPEVAKWDYYKKIDFSKENYEIDKFKRQKKLEKIFPKDLEILICEAPLVISLVYSSYYKGMDHPDTQYILKEVNKHSDYTHYIVTRKLVAYEDYGRNESEKQAEELHLHTIHILEMLGINYTVINSYTEHLPLQVLSYLGAIRKN